MKTFNSQICYRGSFVDTWTQDQIKNEPMFFNCDLDFAYNNGGPITRAFLRALPDDWEGTKENPVVLDSRVHMLMPGWTPCIPGWHHDDVPRGGVTNQPIYDGTCKADHIMGLVNGDIAATRFIVGPVTVSEAHSKALVYKEWSQEINAQIDGEFIPKSAIVSAPSGRLIQFDCYAFHTGVPAVASGWRWFVRVSRNTERTKKITNEIRRQVQVYMQFPEEGW